MTTISMHNHNNKLNADIFLHIAKAPDAKVLDSNFPKRVIIKDASANYIPAGLETPVVENIALDPFEADLITLVRYYLFELGSVVTIPSHGTERDVFIENYLQTPGADINDEMAVYIYKKIKQ